MSKLKIAKTGFDITADERNISLNSDYTNLMIIDEQDITGGTASYTHGLGYLPTALIYFKYGSQWFPDESPIYDTSGTWVYGSAKLEDYDTNKFYFTYEVNRDIKIFITGNAVDNQTSSGKNNATGKLKIAKSGLSVDNITDIRQFQFCSGLDTIKKDTSLSGTTSIVGDGTFKKVEITHNFGYAPIVIAKLTSGGGFSNTMLPVNLSLFALEPVSFYITTNKLVFFTEGHSDTFNINYNIYRNKIN